MKLDKSMRVRIEVANERALRYLAKHRRSFNKANDVALAIWPDHQMTSQGAGAAASRVLKGLQRDGLVEWRSSPRDWGWDITPAGCGPTEATDAR